MTKGTFLLRNKLLDKIRCPDCRSNFNLENPQFCSSSKLYGLLVCSCATYPIVAGIPIIKNQSGTEFQKIQKIITYIQNRDYQKALNLALIQLPNYPDLNRKVLNLLSDRLGLKRIKKKIHNFNLLKWKKKAHSFFNNIDENTKATDLFNFYFLKSGTKRTNPNDYFTYRFGQPRHLSALSLSRSILESSKPVLDLGCGFGHITRGLTKRHNVIGLDNNFYLLFVAKYWIAPDAEYVCCEADADLPFVNDAFCSTICVNSFHFFDKKDHCIKEIKRLIDDKGSIILAALHHSKTKTKTSNSALSVREYTRFFEDMSHTIISDDKLLERYKDKRGPALGRPYDINDIEKETLISIIATHDEDIMVDHGVFDTWPHSVGRLEVNPLYVDEGMDSTGYKQYRRQFPSKFYEEENHLCKSYLPRQAVINPDILNKASYESESQEIADIEHLIASCVLLDMPERYHK